MNRRWEIDALRGLMLVLMTVTHLPTRLSDPLGQPFGFVFAAEGFVLLSAYMAARVYAGIAQKQGIGAMRQAFWRRALKLYGCHALLLLFLFTVVVSVGLRIDQLAVKNLASFYLAQPLTALLAGLALVYEPPLLDILPMYILFMLASPWVLAHAMHHGWHGLLATSIGLWVLAQTSATAEVYTLLTTWAGIAVSYGETGSVVTLGWQFLWMLGLWMGASSARVDASPNASNLLKTAAPLAAVPKTSGRLSTFPHWTMVLAVGLALTGLVWRHAIGQSPFPDQPMHDWLFDKWRLGPLRILNLFALMALVLHFGPWLKAHVPRIARMEKLGAASLSVFLAQLLVVLLTLAIFGDQPLAHAVWVDALILVACFAILVLTATFTLWMDQKPWQLRKALPTR